jgi:hypothetical protein
MTRLAQLSHRPPCASVTQLAHFSHRPCRKCYTIVIVVHRLQTRSSIMPRSSS